MNFTVTVADSSHIKYAEEICNEMESSAKVRGTGISKRSPAYLESKMREGKAIIALDEEARFAGFSYIESWGHSKFVANSGLIVRPEYRKSGLARRIKHAIFELSRKKFPDAKIFGITTSAAVMKINNELGYRPVTFGELTDDETYWQGCSSCCNYDILLRNNKTKCLCTGMLYDPAEHKAFEGPAQAALQDVPQQKRETVVRVGIVGGAGYTAGELIRLLLQHPKARIVWAQSTSHAGQPYYSVHHDLLGDCDLRFTEDVSWDIDVLFICAGHGKAVEFLNTHEVPSGVKVIDLSQDFRNVAGYPAVPAEGIRTHYVYEGTPQRTFVYGLPELQRDAIRTAQNISNPGCFATAFQLALLPLAKAGLLQGDVSIHAITGSTGAGQKPGETTHFSWRSGNLSIYKAFSHQHLTEVTQTLTQLQGTAPRLHFLPLRGDFPRGIFLSAFLQAAISQEELGKLYRDFYRDAALTFVTDDALCMKDVVNTAKCFVKAEKIGDQVLVTSVIDNLLKGASGQAVQNMNLMCGLDERTGLYVKPLAF